MKQFVENRLAKDRKQEQYTNSIKGMLKDHAIFQGHGEAEFRVENLRNAREHTELQREVLLEHNHVKGQQVRVWTSEVWTIEN